MINKAVTTMKGSENIAFIIVIIIYTGIAYHDNT